MLVSNFQRVKAGIAIVEVIICDDQLWVQLG